VADDAKGNGAGGDYKTFVGAGFGTMMVQLSAGTTETPQSASSRAYLRDGLPSLYSDGDFGMRFVGALESVLDPIVAVLDALPEHFQPDYAPRHILNLLGHWLGVTLDETQPISVQRDTIRRAAELGRRRGTKGGLVLALELAFPGVPLRVEDEGGVVWSTSGEEVEQKAPQFVVYCDKPVDEKTQAAIARCIEQYKPVHTAYRLRVRAPKKKPPES
jgi:phage tail-like protein